MCSSSTPVLAGGGGAGVPPPHTAPIVTCLFWFPGHGSPLAAQSRFTEQAARPTHCVANSSAMAAERLAAEHPASRCCVPHAPRATP